MLGITRQESYVTRLEGQRRSHLNKVSLLKNVKANVPAREDEGEVSGV